MGYLTYPRLKILATLLRFLVRRMISTRINQSDDVLQIPSRDAGRTIKVYVYRPKESPKKPSPILLNLHGSGFVLPVHGSDDEFCARVARETSYTVLDMQYRLAPEYPFPAALNDLEDVMNWVLQYPEEFNQAQFAISGFSAGGNIALAASAAPFAKNVFHTLLAFYPSTNKSIDPGDRKTPDPTGPGARSFVGLALSRLFDECYIPPTVDKKNPLISPSFAPLDAFPPNLLFITAAQDNLAFEAEGLAAKIEHAQGKRRVVRRRMEKCVHAWDKSTKPGTIQEQAKNEAYSLAIDMLRG